MTLRTNHLRERNLVRFDATGVLIITKGWVFATKIYADVYR